MELFLSIFSGLTGQNIAILLFICIFTFLLYRNRNENPPIIAMITVMAGVILGPIVVDLNLGLFEGYPYMVRIISVAVFSGLFVTFSIMTGVVLGLIKKTLSKYTHIFFSIGSLIVLASIYANLTILLYGIVAVLIAYQLGKKFKLWIDVEDESKSTCLKTKY